MAIRAKKASDMNVIERRKFVRFDTHLDVEFRALASNPIFGKALVRDLSKEGVKVASKKKLASGMPIEMTLTVPGDNLPVFAIGKVAWADKSGNVGVKFTQMKTADKKRVMEHVYGQWLQSKKTRKAR